MNEIGKRVTGLQHIGLPANHMDDTIAFYEGLGFTKKYEIVNDYLSSGGSFPKNLHIILSAWVGLEMQNPFCLPEAHVRYTDRTTTARDDAKLCGGNCSECACTDDGCWTLQCGEQVVFNEH